MYKIIFIIIVFFSLNGCDDKKIDSKYLTNVTVVRSVEEKGKPNTSENTGTEKKDKNTRLISGKVQYHIIVASYPRSERARAEKLTNGLKSKGYPAQMIESNDRWRVSIESLSTEADAKAQRDKYRDITDRQDIWILRIDN